jgi:hypothetical protein
VGHARAPCRQTLRRQGELNLHAAN